MKKADGPHLVYAHMGAGGRVLYVGCTSDLDARNWEHLNRAPWWPEVERVEVLSRWPSRDEGLAEEKRQIIALRPAFNLRIYIPVREWDLSTYLQVLNARFRHNRDAWFTKQDVDRVRQVKRRFGVTLPLDRDELLAYIDDISTRQPLDQAEDAA
jgi:hypothetical protein